MRQAACELITAAFSELLLGCPPGQVCATLRCWRQGLVNSQLSSEFRSLQSFADFEVDAMEAEGLLVK